MHILGYRKDIIPLMKTFDVMLFTSRYEPFGLVLTEAMAAGVPLVAMDAAGAVSEIVRHGIDGIVVKGLNAEVRRLRGCPSTGKSTVGARTCGACT